MSTIIENIAKKDKPYISFDIDKGKVITIYRFTLLFGWKKRTNKNNRR